MTILVRIKKCLVLVIIHLSQNKMKDGAGAAAIENLSD